MARTLSKSKLLAYRQCPKRLWLEVHHPELREDPEGAQARFDAGHRVGEIARTLYDPKGRGALLDPHAEGFEIAFRRTSELLAGNAPIFEAGFRTAAALSFADVLLPVRKAGTKAWRMVEVKSSTSVKDYHQDDAAIQAYVARKSGLRLSSVAIACIDSTWKYPGDLDYSGLLYETDVTTLAFERSPEVESWIKDAQAVVARTKEPVKPTGDHCTQPYPCGFSDYCRSLVGAARHPVEQLPGRWGKALVAHIESHGTTDLHDVPDELLSDMQLRVKTVALSGKPWFDRKGAAAALAGHGLPAHFLDFETIQFAVPTWKGTRPYQQVPFQFSAHRLSRTGKLEHREFLDLTGEDPSKNFAGALIAACAASGPVFVYNAGFERARIRELASRFKPLAAALLAIEARIVDLLPVARQHYCHPSQQGSWSIKAVLPALCPDLDYRALDGVQDGGMAMDAYLEAIAPQTTPARQEEIRCQLLAYCRLDTLALVRLWSEFSGKSVEVS